MLHCMVDMQRQSCMCIYILIIMLDLNVINIHLPRYYYLFKFTHYQVVTYSIYVLLFVFKLYQIIN